MAITENVVVRIMINKGNADTEIEKVGERGQKAFSMWGAQLATIQKALISMIAVVIAWNALIVIPEKLAMAFKDLAMASAKAADEMQQAIFQSAGLLASFASFGPTIGESFRGAVAITRQMQASFVRLAADSVASAQDVQLAFQTMVSKGGLSFVKDIQTQAPKLAATLASIIIPITGGMQKERQIVSEITGLFENQARAGNLLVRMVRNVVGDVDVWLKKHKELKDLDVALLEIFEGLDAASTSLGATLGGRMESIKGDMMIINEITANLSGGFQIILDKVTGIATLFDNTVQELSNASLPLLPDVQALVEAFLKFQASVEQVLLGFNSILNAITGTNSEAQQLNSFMDVVLDVTINLRLVMIELAAWTDVIARRWSLISNDIYIRALKGIKDMILGSSQLEDSTRQRIKSEMDAMILSQARNGVMSAILANEAQIKRLAEEEAQAREKALDNLVKLHNELDRVIVAENPLAKIAVEFTQRIVEAKKEFKDFPGMMKEAVGILQQMKNIEVFRAMRDDLLKTLKDTEIPIDALLKNIHLLQGATVEVQAPPVQDFFPQDTIERAKQLLKISQNSIESAHRWMQELDMLANQGFLDLDFAMAGTQKQMEIIRTQIELLIPTLNQLQLTKAMISSGLLPQDMLDDTERQISEVQTQMETLQQVFGALDQQLVQLVMNFDPASDAWNKFVKDMRFGADALTNALNGFKFVIASIPQTFAESMAAMIVGGESFVQAFRKAIARTIESIGIEMIAWGMRSVVQGIWPFNPAALAAGAKQIAMGTAVLGMARLVGGSAKAAPAEASAAGGGTKDRQTVVFQPTLNNTGESMQRTLARLTETIEQLRGVPAGQVIVQGAATSEGQAAIATATGQAAQRDTRFRTNLSNAILGGT